MTAKDRVLQLLQWTRERTNDLIKDIPDDKAAFQPSKTSNSAIWCLGHMALTDEWLTGMMSDHKSKMPENYNALFGYKSQPQGNVKAYPPFAEVKKNFQAAREALINAAKAASDKSLEQPLGEKGGGFATDGLDALLKGAWHEGWHAGQIAEVRKALGLKPSM